MNPVLDCILGAINIVLLFTPAICEDHRAGYQFVNPKVIHRNLPLNWFGTVVATIVVNILCPVPAVLYWFYKLCTVGRKD